MSYQVTVNGETIDGLRTNITATDFSVVTYDLPAGTELHVSLSKNSDFSEPRTKWIFLSNNTGQTISNPLGIDAIKSIEVKLYNHDENIIAKVGIGGTGTIVDEVGVKVLKLFPSYFKCMHVYMYVDTVWKMCEKW